MQFSDNNPDYCFVRCMMRPSMRPTGLYKVFLLLQKGLEEMLRLHVQHVNVLLGKGVVYFSINYAPINSLAFSC